MTNRERFHAVYSKDPVVDRCPVIEWAIWWDKTIKWWEQSGLPENLSIDALFDYFGFDNHTQFWIPHFTPDCPSKSHGAPYIRDLEDYLEFKKYLLPGNALETILEKIEDTKIKQEKGETIIWYTLYGFFFYPRELLGIEPHMFSFYDKPDLYHRICEDLIEWQHELVNNFAKHIRADFMTFAEDMSYNNGPMISEALFEKFIAPYYRRLFPEIKKSGTIVFIDSDGDVSQMIPWLIRAGVQGILPLERQAGVNLLDLQQKYPGFFWLGGFDKMCLLKDKEAIDAEFKRIAPMLRKGRFIPSVDHQTPPGVTMENYRYYVQQLKFFSTMACKDAGEK